MRTRRRLLWCLGLLGVFAAITATAFGATSEWGTAIPVPGLNYAQTSVTSISCASAGNCSAAVYIRRGDSFVVDETNGVWGTAIDVPSGYWNALGSISCATADSCAAGGSYFDGRDGSGGQEVDHAFLVNKVHGAWGKAMQVPGISGSADIGSYLSTVSCARPGFCAAAGYGPRSFLVDERKDVWHKAIRVPGSATVRSSAVVNAVSCSGPASCAAGGSYLDKDRISHAYLAEETPGVWWKQVKLQGNTASVAALSCSEPGSCAAGGTYTDSHDIVHAFVADETHGVWHKAIDVPGLAALNHGSPGAGLYSISCAKAGSCAAVGSYTDGSGKSQPFVVSERNGKWGKAIKIPGLAALNRGNHAEARSISCGAPGFCAAGGYYTGPAPSPHYNDQHAFVVTETNGVWNTAVEVPGSAALTTVGYAGVNAVSCGAARSCVAGGLYVDDSHTTQSFVTAP